MSKKREKQETESSFHELHRHCCVSMPENSHYRLCESSLRRPSCGSHFPPSFPPDIGRTLALRPCNYGIASRNGRVPRMFVQQNSTREGKAAVNLEFSARSRVAIKLDTTWNHERFVAARFLIYFAWNGLRFVYRCFDISRLVPTLISTAPKFSSVISHRAFNFHEFTCFHAR